MLRSQSLLGRNSVFSDTLGKLAIIGFMVRGHFALALASDHFFARSLGILILFKVQIGAFEILGQFQVHPVVFDNVRVSLVWYAPRGGNVTVFSLLLVELKTLSDLIWHMTICKYLLRLALSCVLV